MCTTESSSTNNNTTTDTFQVEVKEMVLVSPSDPTPTQVLPLSALDSQLFLRFTIEYLLVYRSAFANRADTITRFKDALARALVPYYPLSGRVRPRPDGKHLEVVCRSQGALFIEAETISQDSQDELLEFAAAPSCKNRWRSLLTVHVGDVLRGLPPLIVQLTWLAHGEAFAIGVGINHCVCDGLGSAEFLNLFAQLVSNGSDFKELKQKPVWERHLLDPITSLINPVPHPEFNRVPDISGFVSRFSRETLSPTSIVFSKKSLNELKKLAYSTTSRLGSEIGMEFTCFEVLSAHVWRSWARSLNLPSQQTLRMLFSVDIRNRVKPGLPGGYYGNGFVLGCAQTTVKKLVNRGLGYGAELVRRAKERVDDAYVRSVVEAVSGEKSCPDSVGVLIVSQWSRLGLEQVDFGAGKPVHVGPVCSDRYCLLLPVFGDRDAVKVMVAVPNSAVGGYEYLVKSPYC